jgi:MFS family permease
MAVEVVAALESGMVIAGIPRWVQIYGDPVKVGWLISGYLVVQAAAAVLGGRLGDMFGRRRAIMVILALCIVGSLISGLSNSLEWMIVGRVVQGSAGALQSLCYGIIRERLPQDKMRFGISVIIATASGAAAVGMVVGGYLTDHFGPQTIFLAMSMTAAIALLLVFTRLSRDNPRPERQRIDWVGGVLFVPGMVILLLGVSRMEKAGFGDTQTLGMIGGGLAILAAWVLYELRQEQPLVDVRLLGNRDIFLANSVMALGAGSLTQCQVIFSMLLQQPTWTGVGLGTSATTVGWLTFPALVAGTLSSLASGKIADKVGARPPMIAGLILSIASCILAIIWHDSLVALAVIMIVSTAGVVTIFTTVPMVVTGVAPAERVSEATGFSGVLRGLFRAFGMQLVAVGLMTSTVSAPGQKPMPDESSFILVLAGILVAAMLALFCALGIHDRGHPKKRVGFPESDPAVSSPAQPASAKT